MNAVECFFRVSNYSYKVSMICLTGLYWHSNGNCGNNFIRSAFRFNIFVRETGHKTNNFGRLQMSPGDSFHENKVWYSTV